MKNYVIIVVICIICVFFYYRPVSALDESTFRQEYKPTYGSGNTRKSFSLESTGKLTPKNNNIIHKQLRDFSQDPQSSPRYNSSCQFGVCMPGGAGQSKNAGN